MDIKPALFYSVSEFAHVLDKGVCIEFRRMIRMGELEIGSEPNKYHAYIRSCIWGQSHRAEEGHPRPRPTSALEELLATIIHELTHAAIIEAGLRDLRTKKAKFRREMQIEDHAYSFLDNYSFFEELFLEIRKRKNCSIVFNESTLNRDGNIEGPFLPYYLEVIKQNPPSSLL
jgi:hypothetical protein